MTCISSSLSSSGALKVECYRYIKKFVAYTTDIRKRTQNRRYLRESSARTQLNRIEADKRFPRPSRILDFSRSRARVCSIGHKNIVKIIFRHRKRKYASVGAKSLITRDSINAVVQPESFEHRTRVKIYTHIYQ